MIASLLAHGIGGRTDLPLPAWQLAWAAGFSVAISFVALGAFWEKPHLAAISRGRSLLTLAGGPGRLLEFVLKLIGLFLFGVILFAAWRGNTNFAANISGDGFLIWFWVGLQFVSALLGNVWRAFNPYTTIVDTAAWVKSKVTQTELSAIDHGEGLLWPAVGAIFAYLWYELAYHSADSPRSIGVFLTLYSIAMLAGASVNGRGWVRTSDGFAVLFSKLSAMSMFYVDDERRLRGRAPLAGLSTLATPPGTVHFVLVVLGSTSFDGFSRSSFWGDITQDLTGWTLTLYNTVGLLIIVALVSLVYVFAINLMAGITGDSTEELSAAFGPSLVPIAAAYAVAHYFSLLALTGQRMFIHISDPFGRGWDLFGTQDYSINWLLVSPEVIAWVQTLAIAVGHVLAVAAAHDRSVERYPHELAVRSQYPMLFVMVVYTVVGLFLLLGA
ncbi:MAG: hypothetical protein ACI9C1_003045 [Candidatus Aldehydirespiratoraceae bacterium]|jgi:hypothetical protein